jgi:methylthioribose-1-phosphate isomerase
MKPVEWHDTRLKILDQTRLPGELVYIETEDYREVAEAISSLKVRGAPAIGVAAAYGIALGALYSKTGDRSWFLSELDDILDIFAQTRPTAVNLFRAISRMKVAAGIAGDVATLKQALINTAIKIHAEEIAATERLSRLGASLIRDGFTILTHCNAGPLATAGYGTALGVIRASAEEGKKIEVFATETRPLLQGARLTTWELMQDKIPVTLITDSMAGYFLNRGKINCVIVGADRIAANGDTANKIGTYSIAVLASENKIPFYVAAPTSTIDVSVESGAGIPIEQRNPGEITVIAGARIAPLGVTVANPSFDVTPNRYINAIITEKGILSPPYDSKLKKLVQEVP